MMKYILSIDAKRRIELGDAIYQLHQHKPAANAPTLQPHADSETDRIQCAWGLSERVLGGIEF